MRYALIVAFLVSLASQALLAQGGSLIAVYEEAKQYDAMTIEEGADAVYAQHIREFNQDNLHSREYYTLSINSSKSKFVFDSIGYINNYRPRGRSETYSPDYYIDLLSSEASVSFPARAGGRVGVLLMSSLPKWRMVDSTQTILGHKCHLAVRHRDDQLERAWFTLDLPLGHGPKGTGGLPGLILRLELPKTTFTCVRIAPASLAVEDVSAPEGDRLPYHQFFKSLYKIAAQ